MSSGSDHSGPIVKKKRHPQLLKLVPARAQSCTDFGDRLPLLPSSMAAAALSAVRQRDSGSPPQFAPFSPLGSSASIASPTPSPFVGIRPSSASASATCCDSSSAAAAVLSPQRKASRSAARFCCSFRRTLRRASPANKRYLAQSDSNQSAPPGGEAADAAKNGGTEEAAKGKERSQSRGRKSRTGSGMPEGSKNDEKKGSTGSVALSGHEESSQELLAKAWTPKRKESRILLPDAVTQKGKKPLEESIGEGGGSGGGKENDEKRESSFSLRRLSKAFFQAQTQERVDLMNDWEIGGTQNPWVCPSDRHLQLRAQLKSGWSVRTAGARSPTTSKQAMMNGISEAEQEQIQRVLARAEQGRQNEQHRIGKMMERLERLKTRATGNGVTQCVLCQTEFGLLAAKSYAAMCSDCRKYVCQRNCGVETFDQKRREPVFLCKICSEYREVMWKKSGAWFYRDLPTPQSAVGRPCSAMAGCSTAPIANGTPPFMATTQPQSPSTRSVGSHTGPMPRRQLEQIRQESREKERAANRRAEPIPIPAEQQQRLKTNPRPRIIPSWVHDGLQQSSISVDDDSDGDSASSSTSSSLEPAQFRKSLGAAKERAMAIKQRAAVQSHQQHHRVTSTLASGGGQTKGGRQTQKGKAQQQQQMVASTQKQTTMQRVVLGRGGRGVTDSESDEPQDDVLSRRSSPSTSPRHSLATPSSYGGDDILIGGGQQFAGHQTNNIGIGGTINGPHGEEKTMSDSRSVDSGVVQSDHSAQQQQQQQQQGLITCSPSQMQIMENMAAAQKQQQQYLPMTHSPSPQPPPIPPRSATITAPPKPLSPAGQQQIGIQSTKRPSSASAGIATSAVPWPLNRAKPLTNQQNHSHSSHESLPSSSGRMAAAALRMQERESGCSVIGDGFYGFNSSSLVPEQHNTSRRSTQSTVPPMDVCKEEQLSEEDPAGSEAQRRDSPTFMSSPEDDSSTLGSIQFNLTYLPEEKQLIIHLIRAKNLKAMDKNGFSDPYVKFHLLPGNTKATKLTSKTIEKTLNPEWNEEQIYYGITEDERLKKTLRVTVLDRDRIGSDFLGETRVALRKLPLGITKKFNLYLEHAMPMPLEKTDNMDRGKILLSVCYNIQQGSLFIAIKRCAELLGMDSTGFSDPYCKISLTPLASKAHRQKTTIKKRTLNPEFNETIQFLVPFKDLPKKTLEIGVYDYDVGRHDDYIGGIVLSTAAPGERGKQWQQVIENPGKTFEYWHKLMPDD